MPHDAIFNHVIEFFDTCIPPPARGRSVCVAVSGGSDSVALFFILSELRERLGISRLGIAHVNHGLRGADSDADAAFVRDIALRARVAFHEKRLGPAPKAGTEEWGRRERYGFFSELKESEGYDFIATGHTADDQAETVLMRIMRGCGLKGLRGIEPLREDGVVRPLLMVAKSSLCAWLSESGRGFREDASNADLSYRRNMVRHRLLPALAAAEPGAAALLPEVAAGALEAWRLLSPAINKWTQSFVVDKTRARNTSHYPGAAPRQGEVPNGKDGDAVVSNVDRAKLPGGFGRSLGMDSTFEISSSAFAEFPFPEEAVAQALRQRQVPVEERHVERIIRNAGRKGGVFLLPGGWRFRCRAEKLEFFRGSIGTADEVPAWRHEIRPDGSLRCGEAGVIIETTTDAALSGKPVAYSRDNMTVYLDADRCGEVLDFRRIKRDDIFQPLGCDHKKNAVEFLKKRKNRGRGGCVAKRGGEIVWIPGVEIGHDYRVTAATSAIRKFSCKYIE